MTPAAGPCDRGDVRCAIVPPYVLERAAARHRDPRLRDLARRYLQADLDQRAARERVAAAPPAVGASAEPKRTIYDARNTWELPGDVVRAEGAPATGDAAADRVYGHLGATFDLFWTAYGRNSIDGSGSAIEATVHYGREYDNAFWNGQRIVYGDGDGRLFRSFTGPIDITAHEFTHGVVQYTARLQYEGQSGAVAESISDVFGSLTKQYDRGQTAARADWLVAEGLFGPEVDGVALRSMSAPGTAYDDDVIGRDPQPAHMDGYVETDEDNGGVHINSGIPNRAFHLAATVLGGYAWQRAGRIWYETLTGLPSSQRADFSSFASATAETAQRLYGTSSAELDAVTDAWQAVGVRT